MPIRKSSTSGIPFGNNANRPANPQVGQTYYNGELGYQEIYTNAGWIPASGGNDFNLNITGTYTTVTFSQSYGAGSYSIVSSSNDSAIDIYAYAADGSLAGYTATKAFSATQRFNKMVIIGGTNGDVLSFSYKTTFATSATTSETTAGPFITSVSPSAMPNTNDTVTITGGNFANDVQVAFTGSGYSSTQAKNVVRSSASSLIVTRPDNFPTSASPYTITITNPGVTAPAATLANISSNSITAGTSPVWNTAATLPAFTKNVAYSTVLSATDPDAGSLISYSVVSNSLPQGLSFNALTGAISGTPTSSITGSITVRATDSGGNFVDRSFTIPNLAPTWVTSTTINLSHNETLQLSVTDDSVITYSVVSGTLPSGVTLSSSGLLTAGSTNGSSSVTIRATDDNGSTADRQFNITIIPYVFTSHTFTNAGATGQNGPTLAQVRSAYSSQTWAQNSTFLSVPNSGIQRWYVPVTGNYTVTIAGARGGGGNRANGQGYVGTTTLSLTQGHLLDILVGQSGVNGNFAGGGGGGSFIFNTSTGGTPLAVSGGGGGGGWEPGSTDASSSTIAGTGSYIGHAGTTDSNAGSVGTSYSNGSGGVGGNNGNNAGAGGFGSGGGGGNGAGGGGGGYFGGSPSISNQGGKGGGSYTSGTSFTSGGLNNGHGYITITKV